MMDYLDIDTDVPSLQDTQIENGVSYELDYELHRWNQDSWEIVAVQAGYGRNVETSVAMFDSEDAAMVAWEQLSAVIDSSRGALHFVSATPSWEIKWFDAADFRIERLYTSSEGLKNQTVMTLEDEGVPFRISETPIEHWSENPLFAAE